MLSPDQEKLLAGITEGWPVDVSTPAEVLQFILKAPKGAPVTQVIALHQLQEIHASVSGRVLEERSKVTGALAQSFHRLPSKLKFLPFGGVRVWI